MTPASNAAWQGIRGWLAELDLPAASREIITDCLAVIDGLAPVIDRIDGSCTRIYGSGKSSVAEEIAYLLEQRGEPYALLDLDYLSWAGTGAGDRAEEFGLLLQNLAAVAANYQRAGIRPLSSPTLSAARARWPACEGRWGCRCGWRA